MANRKQEPNKETRVTDGKAQQAAAREKRSAEALRENLKRRKASPAKPKE